MTKADDKENLTLILCSTIPSVIVICLFSIILLVLVKKDVIVCGKKKTDQNNIIVHKNDLYGNLTNQDYFDQRYDTKITDKNQYYEGEYEYSEHKVQQIDSPDESVKDETNL